MLRELIKSLYAIANAIKGKSDGGNSVEDNYIKFIQPVGMFHVTYNDPPATETPGDIGDISANRIKSITIDKYRQLPIDGYGHLSNDGINVYDLIYNRADVENNTNNKFEYGHYTTDDNRMFTIYFSHEDIKDTISLKELLNMTSNVVNPKFDEINVSAITESNLEDFVVVNVEFPDYI